MKDFGKDLVSTKQEPASTATTTITPRCFTTHPKLSVGKGTLIGGSCSDPVVNNADVYVGLDHYMQTHGSWPWEKKQSTIVDVSYPITDYTAPTNAKTFKDMVGWLCTQLQEGKTVHVGCMGGHGRTGTLLSAIIAVMETKGQLDLGTFKGDAIGWVRKNYCTKAVESESQISFLMKNFGVKKAAAAKVIDYGTGGYNYGGYKGYTPGGYKSGGAAPKGTAKSIQSVKSNRLIWAKTA